MNQNFGDRWPDMATDNIARSAMPNLQPVIALHCFGADGRQWRPLAAALGPSFRVIAPGLIGCDDTGSWCGPHAFRLIDEAQSIIGIVEELDHPVHLVCHSYGAGVALRVAIERAECVASLTLYEPSAFHFLRQAGPDRLKHLAEIEALARAVGEGIVSGANQQAAQTFVDYWNGEGSWISMRSDVRAALVKLLPKASLDFQALIMDDSPFESIRRIACPVLLLRGEFAKGPSRSICEILAEHLPEQRSAIVAGAGHMGPISNADEVNELIRGHLWSQIAGHSDGQSLLAIAA